MKLYNIIDRKARQTGRTIYLYKYLSKDEAMAIAGTIEGFRNLYMIIEAR